jgi:hypothetical protein
MKAFFTIAALFALIVVLSRPLLACTVFFAYDGRLALAGDNEDWLDSNTQMWSIPAMKGEHGVLYFGFGTGEYPEGGVRRLDVKIPEGGILKLNKTDVYGFPQAGVNDQGLFFGGAATDMVKKPAAGGKKPFSGVLLDRIMRTCATVTEALKIVEQYDIGMPQGQILLADKTGDAATIEAGNVILRKIGRHQIITNFRRSQVKPEEVTCGRYKAVDAALAKPEPLSVARFRALLKQTSAVSGETRTQYSLVCDLTHGRIYLHYQGDFDHPKELWVREELARGKRAITLAAVLGK